MKNFWNGCDINMKFFIGYLGKSIKKKKKRKEKTYW